MTTNQQKIDILVSTGVVNKRQGGALTKVFVEEQDAASVAGAYKAALDTVRTQRQTQRAAAARPRPSGDQSKQIFVGGLPFQVDDSGLREVFNPFKLVDARVIVRRDGMSRGFGFVTLETEEDVARAIELCDGAKVDDRVISVRRVTERRGAPRRLPPRAPGVPRAGGTPASAAAAPGPAEPSKDSLYISNLPWTTNKAEIEALLSGVAVKSVRLAQRKDGRNRGYALVTLASEADQQAALAKLQGVKIGERDIRARPSIRRAAGGRAPGRKLLPRGKANPLTLFVGKLPPIVDNSGLYQIFDGFTVVSANIATRPDGQSMGYGFVTLSTPEQVTKALEVVDKSVVEGSEIVVARSTRVPRAPAAAAAAAPSS